MKKCSVHCVLESNNQNYKSIWFSKIYGKIRWEENAPKYFEWSFPNCAIMADFLKLCIHFFCNEHIVILFESEKEQCVLVLKKKIVFFVR